MPSVEQNNVEPGPQAVVNVDPHYLITISGAQTSHATQRVEVEISNHTGIKHRLDGQSDKDNVALHTTDGKNALTFGPFAEKVKVDLYFSAQWKGESSYRVSTLLNDFTDPNTQLNRPGFCAVYTFRTEDAVDNDYHDTFLLVSLIAVTK